MFENEQTARGCRTMIKTHNPIHKPGRDMHADLISSSNGLPLEGQKIEFVLDCRSVAIAGTYVQEAFQSQWAKYPVDRVRSWRHLTPERDPTPARSPPEGVPSSASLHGANHHPLTAGGAAHAA